jgi:recombinational DNA repair protein (RecF pathway)
MPEAPCTREACSCCGSSSWHDAHFVNGRILCLPCWREIEAARRKPASASPARPTLADWLAPQTPREGSRP